MVYRLHDHIYSKKHKLPLSGSLYHYYIYFTSISTGMSPYIREFVYYVYMEKNYSKKTANTYKINLGNFVTYLQTEEERMNVQINDIHKDNIKTISPI